MPTPFILDLDGTLLPSAEVDNRCYWAAVGETFGKDEATLNLTDFPTVTDDALLRAWCRERLGRLPTKGERDAVRARFLALLEAEASREPAAFEPRRGLIEWLEERPAGSLAMATGGWEHTARWKIRTAGLERFRLPLAGSDQDPDRTAIMVRARSLLSEPWTTRIPVYLGDGPWDLAATRALGWEFVGIAEGEDAETLRQAGAKRVMADFRALLPDSCP